MKLPEHVYDWPPALQYAADFADRMFGNITYQMAEGEVRMITHTTAVTRRVAEFLEHPDEELLQAALLHDTIEDTDLIETDLFRMFGTRVSKLVAAVSRDKDEPYEEYIAHCAFFSEDSWLIKWCDLNENYSNLFAFVKWDPDRARRKGRRYDSALKFMRENCPERYRTRILEAK